MSLSKTSIKAGTIPRAFILQQLVWVPDAVNGAFLPTGVNASGATSLNTTNFEDKLGTASSFTAGSATDKDAADEQQSSGAAAEMKSKADRLYEKLKEYYTFPSANFEPELTGDDIEELQAAAEQYFEDQIHSQSDMKRLAMVKDALYASRDSISYYQPSDCALREIADRVAELDLSAFAGGDLKISSGMKELPEFLKHLRQCRPDLRDVGSDKIEVSIRFRFPIDTSVSPDEHDKWWKAVHLDLLVRDRCLLSFGCSTPFFNGKTLSMADERQGYWTNDSKGKKLYHTHPTQKMITSYNKSADEASQGRWKKWLEEVSGILGFKDDGLLRILLVVNIKHD